jgi:hypothetical protein
MKRHHLAVLLLPLLVACGPDPAATSSESVADKAPVAAPAVSREADGAALVAKLRTAFEQLTTARFDASLTGRLGATASGAVDLTGQRPAVRLTPESALFGVEEVRLVKDVGYARIDGEWVRLEIASLVRMLPFDPSLLDLDEVTEALASALSDVEVSGDTGEEVWNATVDPAALLAGLGPRSLDPEHASVPATAEVTVTFTGDRLDALVVDLGDLGALELSLHDQGEPVRITAPRGATDVGDSGWFAYTPLQPGG